MADLVMTQGVGYFFTFTAPEGKNWLGRSNRIQMRSVVRNELLVELTAFTAVDGADATKLHLAVPGSFTARMEKEGVYDVFSVSDTDQDDAFRLPKGRLIVKQGVTQPL